MIISEEDSILVYYLANKFDKPGKVKQKNLLTKSEGFCGLMVG